MFLVAFAYIALVIAAVYGVLVALEAFAPNVGRGMFGRSTEEARQAERDASLAYWRDTNPELAAAAEQAWEDHPAYRADIAKTRRQRHGQAQMRDVWERPFGGGTDAA